MRKIITCSLIALGIAAVTPAMAQSVYVGPNRIGVGAPHGQDYYRHHDRRFGDRDGYYEGRSAYQGNGYGAPGLPRRILIRPLNNSEEEEPSGSFFFGDDRGRMFGDHAHTGE